MKTSHRPARRSHTIHDVILTLALVGCFLSPSHAAGVLDTSQIGIITANDGIPADFFGQPMAIDNDTLVVVSTGADRDPASQAPLGAAYVFVRSGTNWIQQARLSGIGVGLNDNFGVSVAVSGDTVIIGAEQSFGTTDPGHAYVFTRSGTNWSQQAELTASDASPLANFGSAVAVSGDTILVGAYNAPFEGFGNGGAGAAYIFVRSGSTWTQQAELFASDNLFFGWSAALAGDTAVIGAREGSQSTNGIGGAVFVFVRNGTNWTQQAKFFADDEKNLDEFGYSVAMSSNTIVVGADQFARGDKGGAYIFVRNGTNWTQQAKLPVTGLARDDDFGGAVAISGDTVAVGAIGDNDRGVLSGAVYVFGRSGTNWTLLKKLVSSDGTKALLLGDAVAIDGDKILAGGPDADYGCPTTNSECATGAVYIFGNIYDFAVTSLKAPKKITLSGSLTNATGKFSLTIQNRGDHTETIPDMNTLTNVITVAIESLGGCSNFNATLLPPKNFPVVLLPKAILKLNAIATFHCANDPAATTTTAAHNDYRVVATVSHIALDGNADQHTADDMCPHAALGLNPDPDGTIVDKGCGGKNPDNTLGADVFVDVVVRP